jgi:hypothetical protein
VSERKERKKLTGKKAEKTQWNNELIITSNIFAIKMKAQIFMSILFVYGEFIYNFRKFTFLR